MKKPVSDIAFTPTVKAIQQRLGSRPSYERMEQGNGWQTLAFADFRGNRQYLTMGNLQDNDKAFIFLIDFVNRRRIKIWGRATVVEDDTDLLESLADPEYPAKPERVILFHIDAWDINCPQHIKRRYTVEEFAMLDK